MGRACGQSVDQILRLGPLTAMACVRAAVTATWLLAVGVFAVGSAEAQSPADLTVEELVARAISDSPELRAARAEIDAAVGRLRQAGLRPNPMLELGGQKASLDIYERGVRDVATRNLDVVRQAYGLGRSSLLDVIAEQPRYIEVENGYTDILKQVHDAAVEIARATGGITWPER